MRISVRPIALLFLLSAVASPGAAQRVTGRVLDASTAYPVGLAHVQLLDTARVSVVATLADSSGRFVLDVPQAGSFSIAAERFGYVTTVSPLLAISEVRQYELDVELRPDPFQLGPLQIVVRNEEMERWLTLRGHQGNPNAMFGFRAIQGTTLMEARSRARDNADFFRWLFFPVSHRSGVCISIRNGCARVFVDERWLPSEHLETVDLGSVVAVVALP